MSSTVEKKRTRRWFGLRAPVAEDRELTRETLPAGWLPSGDSDTAPTIRRARQLADCYACLRALGDGAALVPLNFFERSGRKTVRVEGGPTVELLERPAPAVPGPAFIGETVAVLAAHGEAFWGKFRGADHSLSALGLLNPERVGVELVQQEPVYTYTHPSGKVDEDLTVDSILHIRGAMTEDGIRGLSPIKNCRDSLGLAQSLTRSAAKLWTNSGVPRGIVAVPPGQGADDQLEAIKKDWTEEHAGPENRGKTGFLTGEVKWVSVALSAADAEWVATRELSTAEIARIFRVPAWVIGAKSGDSLTYANVSEQVSAFARFALAPMLTYVESAVSQDEDLCPGDSFARFDLSELTRGDATARAERNTRALDPVTGWASRNEIREAEGLPPEEEPTA